jgi:hypothetical protein
MSIKRISGKETVQYTLEQYEEVSQASSEAEKRTNIGELVIDIGGDPEFPGVYVANASGYLQEVGGGGGAASGMPYFIPPNQRSILRLYKQGLFNYPITIEGAFEVNGILIEVPGTPGGNGESTVSFVEVPTVYFTAASSGNNQTFANSYLLSYKNSDDLEVYLNGTLLGNGFYDLNYSTLTVTTPLDAGDGITVQKQISANIVPTGGTITINNSVLAQANKNYIANTDSVDITVTLPVAPVLGEYVVVTDGTGNAHINPITIQGNTELIQGTTAPLVINSNRQSVKIVYYDSSQGWIRSL